jgi:hypothetical protein
MELKLYRYSDNGDDTHGLLFINNEFFCYTLEDQHQDEKVKHETRIPSGYTYRVGWQEEVTPMTKRYRIKYPWFDKHLHVKGVKGFNSIYIHVGNDDDDTSGCILTGDGANNNTRGAGKISSSTVAFKRLYHKLKPFINDDSVTIEIMNEGYFI